jgi:formylglycine-generating enzyme required for sulfatase activity
MPLAAPLETWTEPLTGMEFLWVPGGCYQMGCGPWIENCDNDEKPVHEVCLDGFWIGKYEVTNAHYVLFLNDLKDGVPKGERWVKTKAEAIFSDIYQYSNQFLIEKGHEDHPVVEVSWYGANAFAKWLSEKNGNRFDLPTEAQWEYASRSGGRQEIYAGGNDPQSLAWFSTDKKMEHQKVGIKAPNGLGIYDMSGNVWEWCKDRYFKDSYKNHATLNPVIQFVDHKSADASKRVIRGGSYLYNSSRGRCTNRGSHVISDQANDLGFRLVIVPDPQSPFNGNTYLISKGF